MWRLPDLIVLWLLKSKMPNKIDWMIDLGLIILHGMYPWHPWMPYPPHQFPPPPKQDPVTKAIKLKLSASDQSTDPPLGP